MKIGLTAKDRMAIIAILPTQGKLTDLVEILELIKTIKFTKEETESLNLKTEDGKVTWDVTKEEDKEFEITFEQIKIIKKCYNFPIMPDIDKIYCFYIVIRAK